MGPKKGVSSSGDSSDDEDVTTSITTKAIRLKDAKSWPAWRIWFLGQCYTQELHEHFKKVPADNDAKDAKIYGLIACSVGGQAIKVIESVPEGKGSLAYQALEKQFAKARDRLANGSTVPSCAVAEEEAGPVRAEVLDQEALRLPEGDQGSQF